MSRTSLQKGVCVMIDNVVPYAVDLKTDGVIPSHTQNCENVLSSSSFLHTYLQSKQALKIVLEDRLSRFSEDYSKLAAFLQKQIIWVFFR